MNVMFPIEYGSWEYSFSSMRKKFGKDIRGVGNMNKTVLSINKAAVDREIERLKSLVDLGGFIPCPDHRIPLGSKWELIQYYTERMRKEFCK